MPTECDQCHWNNKATLQPTQNSIVCLKGERVWSGIQGLLRIKDRGITYDHCHQFTMEPPTRFERILKED